jgi:hypothetical protein
MPYPKETNMIIVDENRQKGNFAESIATAWLSRQCLVRPVASGTDIGIDLYCESLLGNSPFQHFWVQVKAITEKNIRDSNGRKSAWYRFDTKHLKYWKSQPVPVYAFLVPVIGKPFDDPRYIFSIRLTEHFVKEGIPDKSKVKYESSEGFAIESLEGDLSSFIRNFVPFDAAALLLLKGIIAPIMQPDELAPEAIPKNMILGHIDKIMSAIRLTSEMILAELVEARDKNEKMRNLRQQAEKLALIFESQLNVIGLTAIASSKELDKDLISTIRYLTLARNKVAQTIRDQGEKDKQLAEIDEVLLRLERAIRRKPNT